MTTLIRICARLPLALRIAAARAASRPHHPIAEVIAEMDADRARLDALSTVGDHPASVRAVFDWSYQRLDTSQGRLFRRLGLHPGPEISLHAAAAMADLCLTEARRLLDTLADAHLLEAVAPDRYRLHDLLRAYATDRAEHEDTSDDRDQARRNMLDWYAHHSSAAFRTLFPAATDWHPLVNVDTHAHPRITFAHIADAWTWMETERANLIAAAQHAADYHLPACAILISYTTSTVSSWRGERNALRDLSELGLAAARCSGDRRLEYHALISLSSMQQIVGQLAHAFTARQEALALARALREPWLEAGALAQLGRGCLAQGRYADAVDYLQRALRLSTGAQRGRLEGVIEGRLCAAHIGLGHYKLALAHAERGLTLRRQAGDWAGEPWALGQIARIRQIMGAHCEAIALCEQALSTARDHGYPPSTAATLDIMGTSLQHTGDIKRAITCWRDALDIFDRLADPRAAELRTRLHALENTNGEDLLPHRAPK